MRKLILRILLVFVLIAFGSTAYVVGYVHGHREALYNRLVYDIGADLQSYRLSVAGDTNQLQNLFRFCLFRDSDYYDRFFNGVTVTNQYFIQELADSRAIASQERTNIASVASITNYLPPKVELQIEKDTP